MERVDGTLSKSGKLAEKALKIIKKEDGENK
jgi:hypothetical protein